MAQDGLPHARGETLYSQRQDGTLCNSISSTGKIGYFHRDPPLSSQECTAVDSCGAQTNYPEEKGVIGDDGISHLANVVSMT